MALAKETEARQLLQEQLREQQEQNRQESDKFLRQIDELRETLAANERTSARMEERMQREREDLMAKLQESEARCHLLILARCEEAENGANNFECNICYNP